MEDIDRLITVDEYLEGEKTAEVKSEFKFGVVTAMVGGSFNHACIKRNAETLLHRRLENCIAVSSDMKVETFKNSIYYYPDVVVVCEREIDEYTIKNPFVIVEVMSKSTKNKDRGEKFEDYRRIPTLKYYMVVSQWEFYIECSVRQSNGSWLFREYREHDIIDIENTAIEVKELYEDVKWL